MGWGLEKAGERDLGMAETGLEPETVPAEEPKLEEPEESEQLLQLELQAENQDQQLEEASEPEASVAFELLRSIRLSVYPLDS